MKLFVVTFPNTECDNFAAEVCFELSRAYTCGMKQMPDGRDANYYCIDFGKSKRMAEVTEKRIKNGPYDCMNVFKASKVMNLVYGLYRAEILSEDISLNDYVNR